MVKPVFCIVDTGSSYDYSQLFFSALLVRQELLGAPIYFSPIFFSQLCSKLDGTQPSWYSNRQAATELHFAMRSQQDQKNDHCDGNATSKEIFAMITRTRSKEWSQWVWWQYRIKGNLQNDRNGGNVGSKEKQACSAFLSCEFDPCVLHLACFFGKNEMRWNVPLPGIWICSNSAKITIQHCCKDDSSLTALLKKEDILVERSVFSQNHFRRKRFWLKKKKYAALQPSVIVG